MPRLEFTVERVEYYRNGIAGVGFHVVLFRWKPKGERFFRRMVASVFSEPGHVAILDVDQLADGSIGEGGKFRGDDFERRLREAVSDHTYDAPRPISDQSWDDYCNEMMGHEWFQRKYPNRNGRLRAIQTTYERYSTEAVIT